MSFTDEKLIKQFLKVDKNIKYNILFTKRYYIIGYISIINPKYNKTLQIKFGIIISRQNSKFKYINTSKKSNKFLNYLNLIPIKSIIIIINPLFKNSIIFKIIYTLIILLSGKIIIKILNSNDFKNIEIIYG